MGVRWHELDELSLNTLLRQERWKPRNKYVIAVFFVSCLLNKHAVQRAGMND